ncbi:MAG: hypothetical protein PVH40_07530, partial [Gemmatimonadales bacterium]
ADNDLVIATHGRSFWMIPAIAPLRQLTPEVAEAEVHLFDPIDPLRGLDYGVQVVYFLAEAVDSLTLEFLDDAGTVIQSYVGRGGERGTSRGPFGGGRQSPPVGDGSHTFLWNLRYPGYTDFEGRIFWAAGNAGPVAVPGRYHVRLTVGDDVQTQEFDIGIDPRLRDHVTVADLQARFDLAMRIRDRVSDANEAVIWIREIKATIDERVQDLSDQDLMRQANRVKQALSSVEQEIYQVKNESSQDPLNYPIKLNNKIAALMGVVEGGESAPTDQSYAMFDRLSGLLQVQLDQLEEVVATDLVQLNDMLEESGLDPVEVERPDRNALQGQ